MNFLQGKKKIFFIILFFTLLSFISWNWYALVALPIRATSKVSTPIILNLKSATTAFHFVYLLQEKKIISSPQFFLLLMRLKGLSAQLKAGIYEVQPQESAMQLVYRVVAGDVLKRNFTIIEGTNQLKVAQDLQNTLYLQNAPIVWEVITANYASAEGLLLADTYQYRGGSKAQEILLHAHANLLAYLNKNWHNRTPNLPYKTPYELLTAASIIEKETAIASERKLISGVIVNRLKKNMPLQMDPTVIYALGIKYVGRLSHSDLSINSPYNTYLNKGLPPSPIAMVGKEAIDAAAHPQFSNYLYFVAKGDGSHQFSENYEQQKKAIERARHKEFK